MLCQQPLSLVLLLLQLHQLLLDLIHNSLVLLKNLEVLNERLHGRVVSIFFLDVGHFNVECHWQVIKYVFLIQVAEFLHVLQKAELFSDQVVVFHVVDDLAGVQVAQSWRFVVCRLRRLVVCLRPTAHRRVERCDLVGHSVVLTWLLLPRRQSIKSNAMRDRLPLEVEQRVDGLDLYPPASALQGFSDEL